MKVRALKKVSRDLIRIYQRLLTVSDGLRH